MGTKVLTEEELDRYFNGYRIYLNDIGGDMIRIPSEFPKLLPDLSFSRRLPKLYDGSFLDPTRPIPVPMTMLEHILGAVPKYAVKAEVLFGDYDAERRVLHLTATSPLNTLVKIEWDVRVPQITSGEEFPRVNIEDYKGVISRYLEEGFVFLVTTKVDTYKVHGEIYIMLVGVNGVLRRLQRHRDAWVQNLQSESVVKLDRFDVEKAE